MQYLYSDGDLYYFMDMETFEQMPISADVLPKAFSFVKEEMLCKILSFKGNVFSVEPLRESPLYDIKDKYRLLASPHNAWSAAEAIDRLIELIKTDGRWTEPQQ